MCGFDWRQNPRSRRFPRLFQHWLCSELHQFHCDFAAKAQLHCTVEAEQLVLLLVQRPTPPRFFSMHFFRDLFGVSSSFVSVSVLLISFLCFIFCFPTFIVIRKGKCHMKPNEVSTFVKLNAFCPTGYPSEADTKITSIRRSLSKGRNFRRTLVNWVKTNLARERRDAIERSGRQLVGSAPRSLLCVKGAELTVGCGERLFRNGNSCSLRFQQTVATKLWFLKEFSENK